MISAVLLALYAVVAGTVGAALLVDARWPTISPKLGIAAWQALSASVLLALSLSALSLTIALPHVGTDLASVLDLCASTLRHGYATPDGLGWALVGAGIFFLLLSRLAWSLGRLLRQDSDDRARTGNLLDIVGRKSNLEGAVVIDHDVAYAFCVGGRGSRIVLTTALLNTLNSDQIAAVLAHERAHLRQHHHLVLIFARTVSDALSPMLPVFRRAREQTAYLLELSADDSATRAVGAGALREALRALARIDAPPTALAATANNVELRVRRLAGQATGSRADSAMFVGLIIVSGLIIPMGIMAAPIIGALWEGICFFA